MTTFSLNAFETIAPAGNGVWRAPGHRRDYLSLDFWQQEARVLDEAGFDAMFFVDLLGAFETQDTGFEIAALSPFMLPIADPFTVVSALATVTESLGFVVSASTTYEAPFLLARRFATLDHFTQGRIGWNVVTSYLDSAAANFGLDQQVPHSERYERADEYLTAVTRLWRESWEEDALIADAESGVYADPTKIHRVDHDGRHYRVRGPLTVPRSPQVGPVLYQATASDAGIGLAGRWAEGVLTRQGSVTALAATIGKIQRSANEAERDHPRVFTDVQVIVDRTDARAQERAEELARLGSDEFAFIWSGIDIRRLPRSTRLSELTPYGTTRPLHSVNGNYEATIQDYLDYRRQQESPFAIVGGPETVADRLTALAEETGLSGFNISAGASPSGGLEAFAELVVPALRSRGVLRDRVAAPATLRDQLRR